MKHVIRFLTGLFVITLLLPVLQPTLGQDTEDRRSLYDATGRLVYVSYFKLPWSRIDSLIQLEGTRNLVTQKGRELGCYEDREFLIHQTGMEYNVVYKTYHKEWHWPPQNPGCQNRAFAAAIPDSAHRATLNAGFQWVFGDEIDHRDVIYWEPYPNE